MRIACNPSEKGSFDRACRMACAGDCIVLDPGVYETRGNWAFEGLRTIRNGVRVEANGATIRMAKDFERVSNGFDRPDKDINLLWGDGDNDIIGGTWDGAFASIDQKWNVGGLRFSGRFSIVGATIKGLRGSYRSGTPSGEVEVFGISSEGDAGGSVIKDCIIEECANNAYVTGIYPGSTVKSDAVSLVSSCNCRMGEGNRTGYSASGNVRFKNCVSIGAQNGFYVDTLDCSVILEDCDLFASYSGIGSVGVAASSRNIAMIGGSIKAPRAIEWWDKVGAMDGSSTIAMAKIDSEWLACVVDSNSHILFAGNELEKPVKFSMSTGSIKPIVIL